MNKAIFTILIIFTVQLLSGQEFISKVSGINDTFVELESRIKVTDSVISIKSSGNEYLYNVDWYKDQQYIVNYHGIRANITIGNTSGRLLGFKYSYMITIVFEDSQTMPSLSYLCNIF